MTGFEPATLRPPDVYATGLRHIPNWKCKLSSLFPIFKGKMSFFQVFLFTVLIIDRK